MSNEIELTQKHREELRDLYNSKVLPEFRIDLSLDRPGLPNLMDEFPREALEYHFDQYFYINEELTLSGYEEIFTVHPEDVGLERKVPYHHIANQLGVKDPTRTDMKVGPLAALTAIIDHNGQYDDCPDVNGLTKLFKNADRSEVVEAVRTVSHQISGEMAFEVTANGHIRWHEWARDRTAEILRQHDHRYLVDAAWKKTKAPGTTLEMQQ